jgi:hypothetical protein
MMHGRKKTSYFIHVASSKFIIIYSANLKQFDFNLSQFHPFHNLTSITLICSLYRGSAFILIRLHQFACSSSSPRNYYTEGYPSLLSWVCWRVLEMYFKTDPNHFHFILLKPPNITIYWPNKTLNRRGGCNFFSRGLQPLFWTMSGKPNRLSCIIFKNTYII